MDCSSIQPPGEGLCDPVSTAKAIRQPWVRFTETVTSDVDASSFGELSPWEVRGVGKLEVVRCLRGVGIDVGALSVHDAQDVGGATVSFAGSEVVPTDSFGDVAGDVHVGTTGGVKSAEVVHGAGAPQFGSALVVVRGLMRIGVAADALGEHGGDFKQRTGVFQGGSAALETEAVGGIGIAAEATERIPAQEVGEAAIDVLVQRLVKQRVGAGGPGVTLEMERHPGNVEGRGHVANVCTLGERAESTGRVALGHPGDKGTVGIGVADVNEVAQGFIDGLLQGGKRCLGGFGQADHRIGGSKFEGQHGAAARLPEIRRGAGAGQHGSKLMGVVLGVGFAERGFCVHGSSVTPFGFGVNPLIGS